MSDIALMIDVTERLLPRKGSPDSAASQLAAFSMMIREAPKFTGQKIPESAGRLGVVLSPEGASQKVSVNEKGAGKQTEKVLPTSTSLDYRLRLPSALKGNMGVVVPTPYMLARSGARDERGSDSAGGILDHDPPARRLAYGGVSRVFR
jgi:hypothetical protein